ncbi:protein ANTAGONIST OF LIKE HETEROCHROMATIN PROTEIN 1-like [Nilaparvata lugens]|uniref:protein ANTAGONIST OF LIKE HETEROCHROMATIN PROTEIN 1-like n=1 Tax=Nilaparvata lugens TaxID=108931 RepID=UPI00193D6065|nr:protein ANTAGONIST OF LIKE HETEROCHROMATIN PROTEIN 1-like [Nilaparvata lugens]
MYLFKVSRQLISHIVSEVCYALISTLKEVIKLPNTKDEWMEVERGFNDLWNFPNCLGAIDGKHVVIQAPRNSGSDFFNHKSQFSIVLFALVDTKYSFMYVDVGCKGRISDGGIFSNSTLYNKLRQEQLNLPPPCNLPGRNKPMPHVILADDAFALDINVMKPYAGKHNLGSKERVFNYRLSRARRIVENVFGMMSSIFRVLRKPMLLDNEKAQIITLTCVHLHNFLIKSRTSSTLYCPNGLFDNENLNTRETNPGSWRLDNTQMGNLYSLPQMIKK